MIFAVCVGAVCVACVCRLLTYNVHSGVGLDEKYDIQVHLPISLPVTVAKNFVPTLF